MTAEAPKQLSGRHRDVLRHVLARPLSHNVEWREVLALLREVGSVEERHDGNVVVKAGDHTLVLGHPEHKDVGADDLEKIGHLLETLGYHADEDR